MELQLSKPQLCSNGKRVFAKLRYIWTSGPISDAVTGTTAKRRNACRRTRLRI
jgi:hypothetical protein